MTVSVHSFGITVPVGSTLTSLYTQALVFPAAEVTRVEFTVPDGPRGNVGFSLGAQSTQVLPYQAGQFFVFNDQEKAYDLERAIDSGNWTFFAYNTGSYPHLIQVRFLTTPLSTQENSGALRYAHPQAIRRAGLQL